MSKKRFVQRGLFVFLLLLAFFNNQYSRPFLIQWPEPAPPFSAPWHENIVQSAFMNFTGNGMSLECLNAIIDANRGCDLWHWDNEELHWGGVGWNEYAWELSVTCIRNWMANAIEQLIDNNPSETRKCLGTASHTIADFFSHSNWVENHGQTIEGLSFELGQMPSNFETIHTSSLVMEKDYPDHEGGKENFYKAYYCAIAMTKKEFDDFVKRSFDKEPYNREVVYQRLRELGITPTIKFFQWPELHSVMRFDAMQKISWDHIGVDPDTQVRISLLKNGGEIGYLAEVPITDKQFSWTVGSYYTASGQAKVDPYDPSAFYKIRIVSVDYADAKATSDEFEIKNFKFNTPTSTYAFLRGDGISITWETSDFPVGGTLFLYKGGTEICQIAYLSNLSSRNYNWNIGQLDPGDDYKITIRFDAYPQEPYALYQKFNTSGDQFAIRKPRIEGYVRTASGAGIGDVPLIGLPSQTYTNSNGHYSASVNYGWSGTVIPIKSGYIFSPASRNYTNLNADQTGQSYKAKVKIAGYVRYANGVGVPSVKMSGLPSEPFTDSSGHYSDYVDYGWSGNVCAVKNGLFMLPWVRSYSNVQTDQTGQNYTAKINISGKVRTAGGAGIDGVRLWDLSPDATTGSNGSYSGSVDYVGDGWDGSATPVKPGYTFTPLSRSYSNVTEPMTNQNFTGTVCTYAISPTSATVPASGGSGSFQVTSPGDCPWTASSNRAWITITSGASGKGSGAVKYQVAKNASGATRSGSITVEGKTFSLTQQK